MAVIENRFVCDLSKPVQAQALKGNVFSLDNLGSRLSVLIYNNGQPATISGSVTANCILPDGSTVNVNGGLTTENGGSKAYVDIPQSCLLISGILKIAIKCTSSSVITTLAAIVANVYMTKTDNVITPSQQIINDWNAEISAAIATQNAAIANQDTKINDLKSALHQLAYNASSSATGTGSKYVEFEIKSGKTYKATSTTATNVSVSSVNSSNTDIEVFGNVNSSAPLTFTATQNAARVKFYFRGAGTATIEETGLVIDKMQGDIEDIDARTSATENGLHVVTEKVSDYVRQYNFIDNAEIFTDSAFRNQNREDVTGEIIPGSSTIAIVEVEPSKSYYISQLSSVFYNIVLYDESKTFISSMYTYQGRQAGWNQSWSVPNNCYYVGFVIGDAYAETAYFGREDDYQYWLKYKYGQLSPEIYVDKNVYYRNHRLITSDDSMGNGDTLSFDTSDIKQNYVFSFTGKLSGAFSSIYLAHGKTGAYSGMFVRIDGTNIKFYRYHSSDILVNTVPHGLTISEFITVTVELLKDETAKVILTTGDGMFTATNRWQGSKGSISVGVENCSLTDCVFTYYCDDYDKPFWAFGDSYFYDYNEPRWPEILINNNFGNAMFDGFGGRNSAEAWTSLQRCLQFGKPNTIFWCMGMNDGDSSEEVNGRWNTYYNKVKDYCSENGVELILCTIPTTPVVNNEFKNAIIRASGLRYVDIAAAVGADGTGAWYPGLLSTVDNIHPTELGGKVIASMMMVELPELYKDD